MDTEPYRFTPDILTNLSTEEISGLISFALKANPTYQIQRQGVMASDMIRSAYREAPAELQPKIRSAVLHALENYKPTKENGLYGDELIGLVSSIKPEGAEKVLLDIFQNPDNEKILGETGDPISNTALRVLTDLPGQVEKEGFWEPLLEHPLYYDTAYLAMSIRGYSEARPYLKTFLSMAAKDNSVSKDLLLNRVEFRISFLLSHDLRKLDGETRKKIFSERVKELREFQDLSEDERKLLEDSLERIEH